ncbi:MAG: 3-oxoacyl-[acyl-carrier protein] reductase, partial [uncultured Rubrobacteraceae bacterium]
GRALEQEGARDGRRHGHRPGHRGRARPPGRCGRRPLRPHGTRGDGLGDRETGRQGLDRARGPEPRLRVRAGRGRGGGGSGRPRHARQQRGRHEGASFSGHRRGDLRLALRPEHEGVLLPGAAGGASHAGAGRGEHREHHLHPRLRRVPQAHGLRRHQGRHQRLYPPARDRADGREDPRQRRRPRRHRGPPLLRRPELLLGVRRHPRPLGTRRPPERHRPHRRLPRLGRGGFRNRPGPLRRRRHHGPHGPLVGRGRTPGV